MIKVKPGLELLHKGHILKQDYIYRKSWKYVCVFVIVEKANKCTNKILYITHSITENMGYGDSMHMLFFNGDLSLHKPIHIQKCTS